MGFNYESTWKCKHAYVVFGSTPKIELWVVEKVSQKSQSIFLISNFGILDTLLM